MNVGFFNIKLLCIVSVLFLVGCSAGKIVKTYEGDELLAEQLAVLTAPENIVVLSINGNKMKSYLLSDLNIRYGLKPGENLIVFQHESVWAKAIREDKDAPRSEKIVSAPKEVLLNVKAGEKLTFSFENGSNVREARVLADEFKAKVIDAALNVVAQSAAVGTYQAKSAKAKQTAESLAKGTSEATDLQTLDALKVLWGAATADEKKVFLTWAFQK